MALEKSKQTEAQHLDREPLYQAMMSPSRLRKEELEIQRMMDNVSKANPKSGMSVKELGAMSDRSRETLQEPERAGYSATTLEASPMWRCRN